MNYDESLDYINSLMKTGKKNKTENIRKLLNLMGNPQDKLKFIHIAGTNGKGSTAAMISSVLKSAGYKAGMYVSPHIIDFRERIQINFEMIAEEKLARLTEEVKKYSDELEKENIFITYFEFITAVAFKYFYEENCDIAVLETGIGGRDDATNIIKNTLVSVITSVSIDHTDMLGDTIEEIAQHKCGIIKENSIVVSYPNQQKSVFDLIHRFAEKKNCEVIIPKIENIIYEKEKSYPGKTFIKYNNQEIKIPFTGEHQIYNFATVSGIVKALKKKNFKITDEDLKNGVESTSFPVRAEVLSQNPLVIVDGAHNKSGAEALKKVILSFNKKTTVIMGMFKDKDFKSAVEIISSAADEFIAVTPNYYRALPSSELIKYAEKFCQKCSAEESVISAYENALKKAGGDEALVICGSLYLASEIREYILNKK